MIFLKINSKIFLHIDANSAFLSWTACEILKKDKNLDIRNIASAIAGDPLNRHGIILAKSTLAKKCNVVTGETIQSALSKCKDLKIYKPDYNVYKKYSNEMGKILMKYSANIEQYSIDEYFIEYVPLYGDYLEVAKKIQNEIYTSLGFTVNIGISDKKVLAKMASDFEKPNRIHTLFKEEIKQKLWPLPIESLFLCGKKTSNKLRSIGIDTIGKLANSDVSLITFHLKSQGKLLHDYANGIDESCIEKREKNKCLSNSVTTPEDITTLEHAFKTLLSLTENLTTRLRDNKCKAHTITLQIKLNNFETSSHSKTFSIATNSTKEIYNVSKDLLVKNWNGLPIRLLGVTLSNLIEDTDIQLDFFSEKTNKELQVNNSIDNLLKKYGNSLKITRCSNLISNKNNEN